MKRRLFNLAAAVSLVLMLALAALWLRSYWRHDHVDYVHANRPGTWALILASSRGSLRLAEFSPRIYFLSGFTVRSTEAIALDDLEQHIDGFGYGRIDDERRGTLRIVSMPHWFAFTSTAVLPGAWLLSRYRRRLRRARAGCCAQCGYDLRATPDRCPECGTAAAPKPAEAAA